MVNETGAKSCKGEFDPASFEGFAGELLRIICYCCLNFIRLCGILVECV